MDNGTCNQMTEKQAKLFWNALTLEQKRNFNKMLSDLREGKLRLTHVGVDDNEQIQRIVLDQKDKPGKPTKPFAKHFKQD